MTTNCVRSFEGSGSAPVSDPEESPTRREGALPRRVVRSFLGLNGLKRLKGLLRNTVRLFGCSAVHQLSAISGSLPAASCQLPAGSGIKNLNRTLERFFLEV